MARKYITPKVLMHQLHLDGGEKHRALFGVVAFRFTVCEPRIIMALPRAGACKRLILPCRGFAFSPLTIAAAKCIVWSTNNLY